ncbi:alanine--tRNA ligase [soil metagenome]
MKSDEIRSRFLKFFEKKGHTIIPSASLVPENDPSVLFNTAGMQPLVPYLLGEPHPAGKRIVDVQKCVRTGDLDDIGDNRHLSFFEMLGNWSLGDYFKEEAINWSYEFLTSKDEGLGLDPSRLYVTVFEGDENAPFDQESKDIWMKAGISESRIYALGAEDNWWSPGDNGPCGPDTEMFYDMSGTIGDLSKEEFLNEVSKENIIEIWNDVFMEYEKKDGKVIGKLAKKNVDTGAGLERITAVMQNKKTAYDTDLFQLIMEVASPISPSEKSKRIISDHVRTAVFMIADGVIPSNTDAGYVLRRLIRRAVRLSSISLASVIMAVINTYKNSHPELDLKKVEIEHEILQEEARFKVTLAAGLKQFEKGEDPFVLFTSYGFPFELTEELAKEKGIKLNKKEFDIKFKAHQDLSRTGAEQKFKGGLAGTGEAETRYHTATHLLHQALHDVLGEGIAQKGSNITSERLRFDFSFDRKMTAEEIEKVEKIVNDKINEHLNVEHRVFNKAEAEKTGARHFFDQKYPDQVSVYYIGDSIENAYSKEFCGGPHVLNTSELGNFKILKEEAVSAGVRRIKAILT